MNLNGVCWKFSLDILKRKGGSYIVGSFHTIRALVQTPIVYRYYEYHTGVICVELKLGETFQKLFCRFKKSKLTLPHRSILEQL